MDSKLGDVGLQVRLEAVKTASLALEGSLTTDTERDSMIARLCALTVESSDKMRSTVAETLRRNWQTFGLTKRLS